MSRISQVLVLTASIALFPALSHAQTSAAQTQAINVAGSVNEDRVNVRRGPGNEFDRFHLLDRGSPLTAIAIKGEWVQIRLSDGRQGWINGRFALYSTPVPTSAVKPAASPTAKPEPATKPETAGAKPASGAPATATTPQPVPVKGSVADPKSGAKPSASIQPSSGAPIVPENGTIKAAGTTTAVPDSKNAPKPETKLGAKPEPAPLAAGLASATKPDAPAKTQDSPVTAVGDGWKMILYLVPVLAVVLVAVRMLKSVQQKGGDVTNLKSALMGGLTLSNAKKNGGNTIKVVETVPMGQAALHVVEVRGRTLLLGATGGSINLLTELKSTTTGRVPNDDFESLLRKAGAPEEAYRSSGMTIGDIEDDLRETKEAIIRAARQSKLASAGNRGAEARRG